MKAFASKFFTLGAAAFLLFSEVSANETVQTKRAFNENPAAAYSSASTTNFVPACDKTYYPYAQYSTYANPYNAYSYYTYPGTAKYNLVYYVNNNNRNQDMFKDNKNYDKNAINFHNADNKYNLYSKRHNDCDDDCDKHKGKGKDKDHHKNDHDHKGHHSHDDKDKFKYPNIYAYVSAYSDAYRKPFYGGNGNYGGNCYPCEYPYDGYVCCPPENYYYQPSPYYNYPENYYPEDYYYPPCYSHKGAKPGHYKRQHGSSPSGHHYYNSPYQNDQSTFNNQNNYQKNNNVNNWQHQKDNLYFTQCGYSVTPAMVYKLNNYYDYANSQGLSYQPVGGGH